MPKHVIVTEKPSVARQFAQALGVTGQHQGYMENDEWIITWCVGHLVELSYPEKYDENLKHWDMNTLPFLPETYRYEVIEGTKDQFDVVKEILNRPVDVIYNAGDSGREGEYIQRLTYIQAGVEGKKRIMRVWIDSQTDEEILRGIREAKPEQVYDNLFAAATERSVADYALGINLSRALTCKFGYEFEKKNNLDKHMVLSVGRVMTCVLGMVVERERDIRNFRPTSFYKIDASHGGFTSHWKAVNGSAYFQSPLLYNDSGFLERKDADALLGKLQADPSLVISRLETKTEKRNAPLLYNLAELQADCTKRFHISPDDTLSIAQSLYEQRLTTYPRTDARVLSTPVAKEITKNISGLGQYAAVAGTAKEILENHWQNGIEKTKYTDDAKITDHYAIIPTGQVTDALEGLEKQVYELICRRFLAIFYPAAEYSKTSVELTHSCGEKFYASERFLTKKGYLAVYNNEEKDGKTTPSMPDLEKGQALAATFAVVPGQTKPPKRYTSGSMILAMENAGTLIEDEELRAQIKGSGIGTSATRAATITKLVKDNFLKLEKKTQILTPTRVGEAMYDLVKENIPSLLSPKMTASWEKGLAMVEKGEYPAADYRKKMEGFIRKCVEEIKQKTAEQRPITVREALDTPCPACGSTLYQTEKAVYCSKWRKDGKGCGFVYIRSQVTEEEAALLLQGKDTPPRERKGKNGPFTAGLHMDPKTGKILFAYQRKEAGHNCPVCGKPLLESDKAIYCSGWAKNGKGCGFAFSKAMTTPEEQQSLMEGKDTEPREFQGKKGPFTAMLRIDKKTGSIVFAFPTKTSDKTCPACGKPLEEDGRKYTCSCGFTIPTTIAHHALTQEDINVLYTDKKTHFDDMVSKAGKNFGADVILQEDGSLAFDFGEKQKTGKRQGARKRRFGKKS